MTAKILDTETVSKIVETQSLMSVFQPIYDLNSHTVFGHEALTRTISAEYEIKTKHLFDAAHIHGFIEQLESVTRKISLESFNTLNLDSKLFLNFSPMCLKQHSRDISPLLEQLNRFEVPSGSIVIELSEKYPLDDIDDLHRAIDEFHAHGFEIAIDDLGAGYAGLKVWSELLPDYVKVDRYFVKDIHEDPVKREFIRSIQNISDSLQCKVIAEGIETDRELQTIQSIGINYAQGFGLSAPKPEPDSHTPKSLKKTQPGNFRRELSLKERVGDLVEATITLEPDNKLELAADIFQKNRLIQSIPVVKKNRPVGILFRNSIMEIFFGRYGRELHAKKRISRYMDKDVLMVESDLMLEDVSRLITNNPEANMGLDFIITRDERYLGVGSTRNLLKKITNHQIKSARYSNPLTMLPGNVPIYENIDNHLNAGNMFYIAYIDVDNFKPYNDFYSYSRGDEILLKTAELLIKNTNPLTEFVGHVGGDDFVVIFQKNNWRKKCEKIVDQFEQCLPLFYNRQDFEAGGIISYDRKGKERTFPLVTLSVGIASPDVKRCKSHHDVAALAADAKRQAKSIQGSSIFLSRRRRPDDAQHLLTKSA